VEPPNELEVSHAFTRKMGHLLCVMKAITNFKSLLSSRSVTSSPRTSLFPEDAAEMINNIGGHVPRWTRHHRPKPSSMDEHEFEALKRANEEHAARLLEQRKQVLRSRGGNIAGPFGLPVKPPNSRGNSEGGGGPTEEESGRAHGERDPQASPGVPALLGIGTGGHDNNFPGPDGGGGEQGGDQPSAVADSPTAVDFNVYDRAYEEEVARIKAAGGQPSVYMTWHLNSKDRFHGDGALDVKEEHGDDEADAPSGRGERGRDKIKGAFKGNKFAELVSQTIRDTRARSREGLVRAMAGAGGEGEKAGEQE
jgi:calcium/calmodulin-dependent protein kinase kinase 2